MRITAFILLLVSQFAQAQNLYVFSVIETGNAKRADRLHDVDRLHRLADNVARYGNYTQYWYDFGDSAAFTVQSVQLTLAQLRLRASEQDVVWFYFSGLGHNDGQRAWPTLHLNGGELPMRDVIALLRPKLPRTLLITVDCGNSDPPPTQLISNQAGDDPAEPTRTRLAAPAAVKPHKTQVALADVPSIALIDNYRHLFRARKLRQVILASSATRGQRSYSETLRGAVWLQALERALTEATADPNQPATWADVHKRFTQYTQERTQTRQTPGFSRETTTCCDDENDF